MLRETVEIGKHNKPSDPVIENYHALMAAIFNKKFSLQSSYIHLFDKEEEVKRIEELDEAKAKQQKTELQKWWKDSVEKEMKTHRMNKVMSKVKKPTKYQDKYNLKDCSEIPKEELAIYKLKVIDIKTGKSKVYETRQELAQDIGIDINYITNPYLRRQIAYKDRYIITISED